MVVVCNIEAEKAVHTTVLCIILMQVEPDNQLRWLWPKMVK